VRTAHGFFIVALLLILGNSAHAELWCGHGPGTPLDHPCSDWDTEADPAVTAAIDDNFNEWTSVPGVWQVQPGTELSGDPHEIRIYVEPRRFASAKRRLPSQAGSIPIVVIRKAIPTGVGDGSFVGFLDDGDPRDPELAESQDKAMTSYTGTTQEYGELWNNPPGVVGIGPANCGQKGCDFSIIEITVQPQLMDAVKEQIPNAINGIAIVLSPYQAEED
jgi:hypothetical protein